MAVLWLDDIRAEDLESVGGKGASLGELAAAGLPVPDAFVVTAGTYRTFLETAEIESAIEEAVDVDVEKSAELAAAAEAAAELIYETGFSEEVEAEILAAYDTFENEPFVAVRSSATAEDLPDASFAGQQETYLNVDKEGLLRRIKDCWASLFTQRAIYYRKQQGFDIKDVDIAVVVQLMVDATKSGVMFTSHPSTGDSRVIIEAAWGLGEAVVSGSVSPDNYVVDGDTGEILDVTVAEKKLEYIRDDETGETIEREIDDDRRTTQVLTEEEISSLVSIGANIEEHYGVPQDVEWAIVDDEIHMLQSRPITTIANDESVTVEKSAEQPAGITDGNGSVSEVASADSGAELLRGLGASPGTVTGTARIVGSLDQLDKVGEGDILVTEMTTPDMVPAMKRAGGIITDEGGMTSHASIVSRELGVPAVVGTGNATTVLEDGELVLIDGERGTIEEADEVDQERTDGPERSVEAVRPSTPVKPMTATEVKVNVSIPEAAERAAATGADGVGLLRLEHMVLSLGMTPDQYIREHGKRAYQNEIVQGVRTVADHFYPRPVRVRTLDAPTDEFRTLDGGEDEPEEHNPMLGFRGIRRSIAEPNVFRQELEAFHRLFDMGYDNVEIMFPLVNDASDVRAAVSEMKAVGLDPERCTWGVMIETPASALVIESIAAEGIDFASFGTNDLTQYILAVDRNNEHVADRFDELHPAVLEIMRQTISTCRELGVRTSICGQAGSKPEMVRFLVNLGVSSISANIDAVRDVQHEAKRTEQKILLDSIR